MIAGREQRWVFALNNKRNADGRRAKLKRQNAFVDFDSIHCSDTIVLVGVLPKRKVVDPPGGCSSDSTPLDIGSGKTIQIRPRTLGSFPFPLRHDTGVPTATITIRISCLIFFLTSENICYDSVRTRHWYSHWIYLISSMFLIISPWWWRHTSISFIQHVNLDAVGIVVVRGCLFLKTRSEGRSE